MLSGLTGSVLSRSSFASDRDYRLQIIDCSGDCKATTFIICLKVDLFNYSTR
jgi:hypothetical protein